MGHIFGHKWTSTYGETAFDGTELTEVAKTWASGMRGLSGDQVANGLRECVDCGEAWPPTLPEFVTMCKGKALNRFGLDYVPECYREEPVVDESKLLTSDQREAAKEKHKEEWQKVKDNLKSKTQY